MINLGEEDGDVSLNHACVMSVREVESRPSYLLVFHNNMYHSRARGLGIINDHLHQPFHLAGLLTV